MSRVPTDDSDPRKKHPSLSAKVTGAVARVIGRQNLEESASVHPSSASLGGAHRLSTVTDQGDRPRVRPSVHEKYELQLKKGDGTTEPISKTPVLDTRLGNWISGTPNRLFHAVNNLCLLGNIGLLTCHFRYMSDGDGDRRSNLREDVREEMKFLWQKREVQKMREDWI